MSKIGNSHKQSIKNHLWEIWYWSSLFKQFHKREPNLNELTHLKKILKTRRLNTAIEWAHVYEHVYGNNARLDIKLWNKTYPSYRDSNFQYAINHKTGIIYIIDKLQDQSFSEQLFLEGYYTIYKNKFAFQQYIDNKMRRKQKPGSIKLVGRSCVANKYIYVKKINSKDTQIIKWNKNRFAKYVNTRSNNLPHYYDKPRGHKGYWISLNHQSSIFEQHQLPKYAHYTSSQNLNSGLGRA